MVVGREAFYDGANLTLLVSGSDRPASSALVSFLGPVMPQITHEQRRRRREKIAQAVASGRSVSAAVRQFRVTRSTVYRACADLGLSFEHEQRRQRREAIALAVASGASRAAAARRFGISLGTVHRACTEHGLSARRGRPPGPSAGGRGLEILAALLSNSFATDRAIADTFGVTRQRVDQIRTEARKAGVPLVNWPTALHLLHDVKNHKSSVRINQLARQLRIDEVTARAIIRTAKRLELL